MLYNKPTPSEEKLQNFKQFCKHPMKPTGDKLIKMNVEMKKYAHLPIHLRIMSAVAHNDPWAVEELFMQGCPVDYVDERGYTALHVAANFGFYECALILVNCGHEINPTTIYGYTPMYVAKASGAVFIYRFLKEQGGVLLVEDNTTVRYESCLDVDHKAGSKGLAVDLVGKELGRRRGYRSHY